VIGRAATVLVEERPDVRQVEQSGDERPGSEHLLLEIAGEGTGDPLADRRGESPLRQRHDLLRQPALGEPAQQPLGLEPGHLPGRGDAERQLDHLVVQQRTADLQAVRHAHPVHLRQDVVGQVDGEVGVLGALDEAG
jgi:hypothetical protein